MPNWSAGHWTACCWTSRGGGPTQSKDGVALPTELSRWPGGRAPAAQVRRPPGLGKLRGRRTEVALPVVGTFTAPGRGSLRADAVLTAPEDGVPVLVVEVDNHTEPPAAVADKIARYRKFFQRSAKDHLGRDVPLWSTLWEDSGRGGFPPVALVFTKPVGPRVMQERIGEVGRLSQEHWQGRWHTDYTSPGRRARRLPRLRRHRARARHHPGPARRQGTARAGVMALRPQCGRDPGAGPRQPRRPPRLPPARRRAPRRP
ncbi:replication-relaxation family protein [Streptomyces nigra]|uniref:replication-relaxation family protein n=1 Tax=Streptomyces nigra TaxID=1827580 RepID=UPI0038668E02